MIKKLLMTALVALFVCLVAAFTVVAQARMLPRYSFNNGEYVTGSVQYTETPCEDYWVGVTEDWDGDTGWCAYSDEIVAAALKGNVSTRQRTLILSSVKAGRRGSPVAILD